MQRQTPRLQFHWQKCISSRKDNRSRVEKGMIDDEFYVQKIVQCSSSQELFYRSILNKRETTSMLPITKNAISLSRTLQTVYDKQLQKHYLCLFSPYIPVTSLIEYTSTKTLEYNGKPISYQEKATRIAKIIAKTIVLLMGKSNHQLYSFQTFLFDQSKNKITINQHSFVGMAFMMKNQEPSQEEFLEIVQLFQSKTLEKNPEQRFSIQLKLRSLGVLLLSLAFDKRFRLFIKKQTQNQVQTLSSLQKHSKIISKSPESFKTMLRLPQVRQLLSSLTDELKTDYLQFLERVFVKEQKLSWSQVCRLLVPIAQSSQIKQLPLQTTEIVLQIYTLLSDQSQEKAVLKELELTNSKQFLLILLSDDRVSTEDLLHYSDIDRFLFEAKKFNANNQTIFKKLLCIVAKLLTLKPQDKLQLSVSISKLREYIDSIASTYGVFKTVVRQKQKDLFCSTQNNKTLKKYTKLFK